MSNLFVFIARLFNNRKILGWIFSHSSRYPFSFEKPNSSHYFFHLERTYLIRLELTFLSIIISTAVCCCWNIFRNANWLFLIIFSLLLLLSFRFSLIRYDVFFVKSFYVTHLCFDDFGELHLNYVISLSSSISHLLVDNSPKRFVSFFFLVRMNETKNELSILSGLIVH